MKILGIALFLLSTTASAQTAGGGFEQQFFLHGNSNDGFGRALCLLGDLDDDGVQDFAIGAPDDSSSKFEAGSVNIFSGATGTLLRSIPGRRATSHFGWSVANAGDVDADGVQDLVVGAPYDSLIADSAGIAYVYSGANGALLHQFQGQASYRYAGWSVAGPGDLNGDGHDDVLVGEPGPFGANVLQAKVKLYSGKDGSLIGLWQGQNPADGFGRRIAAAGDVNQDGVPDISISARDATSGAGHPNAGAVFVYSGADGSQIHHLEGNYEKEGFGYSLANAGDLDADGSDDLLIGSFSSSPLPNHWNGAARVYSGSTGALIHHWIGERKFDEFGIAVSAAGDMNQDGILDIAVGASSTTWNGVRWVGSVFVFSGSDGSLVTRRDASRESSRYGSAIASAGDIDGNGYDDLLVSAAYVYSGNSFHHQATEVIGFQPYMTSDATQVSAASGGSIEFTLDYPSTASNHHYRVLISATGTGPSFYGVEIPLSFDALTFETFMGNYPIPSSQAHGSLNADGDALCTFILPAGLSSSLVGSSFYFAAIENQAGLLPQRSSVAVAIQIVP
jgi:hypothetical protein